ncbi:putative Nuclear RNA export factor 1 protein, partial [Naja naja]
MDAVPKMDETGSRGRATEAGERFPKLLRLDGHDLPPPISFDLETPTTLPQFKGSYFASEGLKMLIVRFLQQTALAEYFKNSRNVKRLKDPSLRFRLLKHTKLNVSTAALGTSCEPSPGSSLRFLWATAATITEIRKAFVMPAPTPSSSPVPTPSTEPMPSSSPGPILTAEQQEMLQNFSLQSGMNLEWSQKCLLDNEWNYTKAAHAYTQLKAEQKIPEIPSFVNKKFLRCKLRETPALLPTRGRRASLKNLLPLRVEPLETLPSKVVIKISNFFVCHVLGPTRNWLSLRMSLGKDSLFIFFKFKSYPARGGFRFPQAGITGNKIIYVWG